MPGVTPKTLVATITRQRHGHMPARQPRYKQRRNLRFVREWLIPHPRQFRDDSERLIRGEAELGMLGAEMTRHLSGMARFIKPSLTKANREGADSASRLGLHERDDRRA